MYVLGLTTGETIEGREWVYFYLNSCEWRLSNPEKAIDVKTTDPSFCYL